MNFQNLLVKCDFDTNQLKIHVYCHRLLVTVVTAAIGMSAKDISMMIVEVHVFSLYIQDAVVMQITSKPWKNVRRNVLVS